MDPQRMSARMRRLVRALEKLRVEAGLNMVTAAAELGVSPSMISRIESGHRWVRRDDLVGLMVIYRVDRQLRKALLELHEKAEQPGMVDRGELNVHEDLHKWISFEEDATEIRNYESLLIPGLLQTFAYARALFDVGDPSLTDEEKDKRVAARIARQTLLRGERPPRLHLILHQAALHQKVGGAAVMRDQLDALVQVAQQPNICVRVVPADVGAHPGMAGPFVIMDYAALPSLVHIENKVASLYLEEKGDIEAYRLAYSGLSAVSLPPDRSAHLIRRIAMSMRDVRKEPGDDLLGPGSLAQEQLQRREHQLC
jgi:transcriptional regulator with XRE-family HTH domain